MHNKGFTLVELLAVIVVLAIVLTIAVPSILKITERTKKEALSIDATTIAKYLETNRINDSINIETFTKEDLDSIGIKSSKYDGFGVTLIKDRVVVTLAKDGYIVSNKLDSKVYGVFFDGIGSTGIRTDDAVGLMYQINASTITSDDFDNEEIYGEIEEVTDNYGNVFIKIPRFWIKKTVDGKTYKYQISRTKQDMDYYLPSCFYDEASNKILPYVLVGKYNASLSADGTKLESKSGKEPLVNKSINQFRDYARANNVGINQGYQLLDIHAIDMLQTLFYVEFATLDSQSVMQGFTSGQYNAAHTISGISGNIITLTSGIANYRVGQMIDVGTTRGGRQIAKNLRITNVSGSTITYEIVTGISEVGTIAANHIVYNVGYLTGTTNDVTTPSGSPTSNSDGKYAMKYRGVENLYGNIYQFVDGINVKDNQSYVARDANLYESDIFAGAYKKLNYKNAATNNYVLEMGYDKNNPFIQLPKNSGTLEDSFYKDYYYQYSDNRVALIGGNWYSGIYAGFSFWSFYHTSSSASIHFGGRLLKMPL